MKGTIDMAAKLPKKRTPKHEVLNLRDPELFDGMMKAAERRGFPKMSLSAIARVAIKEWSDGQK